MSQTGENTQGPTAEQWSAGKAIGAFSAAWLALSLANVLLTLGAYFALEPLFRNVTASDVRIYLPAAAFVMVGAVWLVANWAARRYLPKIGDGVGAPILDASFWMLFVAVLLQTSVLLFVLVRIDAPITLSTSAAITAGLIGSMINRWGSPHLQYRIPPKYPTRRSDAPTAG